MPPVITSHVLRGDAVTHQRVFDGAGERDHDVAGVFVFEAVREKIPRLEDDETIRDADDAQSDGGEKRNGLRAGVVRGNKLVRVGAQEMANGARGLEIGTLDVQHGEAFGCAHFVQRGIARACDGLLVIARAESTGGHQKEFLTAAHDVAGIDV